MMSTGNTGTTYLRHLALFFYEILVAACVECSSRIVEVTRAAARFREQEISFLHFASPAHKMVTSMPLMSKSGQIMHRHPIIQRDYG